MNKEQTHSWILLAIGLASQKEPTDIAGIIMIADGINCAVPEQKELQGSISWLLSKGLINKLGKKYELTLEGKSKLKTAEDRTLIKTWSNLEKLLKNSAQQRL